MQEGGRLSPLELAQLVSWLGMRCGMVSLGILHGHHGLLHSLQHMLLHDQHLLQCGWWWWVALVVAVVDITVPSVRHLKRRRVHKIFM
jgi:hypothetical protein